MTRGEMDYTQRVLATIRPSGIVGGRLLYEENFEDFIVHGYISDSGFSLTRTQGEVWRGAQSGKLTSTDAHLAELMVSYIVPTPRFISTEIIFRPLDGNLRDFGLTYVIRDPTTQHLPLIWVRWDGSHLKLEATDSTYTDQVMATVGTLTFAQYWHILYCRLDLAAKKYTKVQFDNTVVTKGLPTYPTTTLASSPAGYVDIETFSMPSTTNNTAIDDLYITYEEP